MKRAYFYVYKIHGYKRTGQQIINLIEDSYKQLFEMKNNIVESKRQVIASNHKRRWQIITKSNTFHTHSSSIITDYIL